MLQKGVLLVLGMLFGKCDPDIYKESNPPTEGTPTHDGYGAETNDTGRPIGGGPGYGDWQDPANGQRVSTLPDLVDALAKRSSAFKTALDSGAEWPTGTIYVDDDAVIDVADQ